MKNPTDRDVILLQTRHMLLVQARCLRQNLERQPHYESLPVYQRALRREKRRRTAYLTAVQEILVEAPFPKGELI
jgi:hypothetical protein